MKNIAIIQARMTSERLPGKILKDLCGKPVLINIVERVRRSKELDDVVVATSVDSTDDIVEKTLIDNNIHYYRGSLENVLERFYMCASEYNANTIIRLTADNALIDPEIIDDAIQLFRRKKVDYLHYKVSLPLGMGVEIFSFKALKKAYFEASDVECLEHVTPYIQMNEDKFRVLCYIDPSDVDLSYLRFTMDTQDDYRLVSSIYEAFGDNLFSFSEVLELISKHPELAEINKTVIQKGMKYTGENKSNQYMSTDN